MSQDTRQLAKDLIAIRRTERLFEALNRPAIRSDRAKDVLGAAHRVLAVCLGLIAAMGGVLIIDTLITL